jgi:hypothetical protein
MGYFASFTALLILVLLFEILPASYAKRGDRDRFPERRQGGGSQACLPVKDEDRG